MNDTLPYPVDVQAPQGALAWSPSRGFIFVVEDLDEAHGEGEIVLAVEHGLVHAVEGDCPLAVAVRQDRHLAELRAHLDDLHIRLVDVFEAAVDKFSRR